MNYNKIFKETNIESDCAYLGWERNIEEYFWGIKKGYKNSADDLVDIAIEQGEKGRIDIQDTYIFPIMFLYRHCIEISLKLIFLKLNGKSVNGHDLYKIWSNSIKNDLSQINMLKIPKDDINMIEESLKQLDEWDFNGENWKYASDKKGNVSMKEWRFIDYKNLKIEINKLFEVLDTINFALENI